ncbi:unnamed protein product [Adineta steineri]|uniref:F-box domain-containing protein n=1 Tax=Adineta steineri TaxID=433720 RepID=A0A814QTK5_9BILA|nr:unnamed protein product [Adineta steineri]CAF1124911.1 unnamed protein product [Adineta steineri]
MKARAEHLPIEIWLIIYSYFEIHELFHIFNNLNYYFNSLLNSHHLSFYLRLVKNDENDRNNLIKTNFNRITYLQSTLWHLSGGFPKLFIDHIDRFTKLKSLKVHISNSQTKILCQALQQLPLLEYLSLRCQMTEELLTTVLSTSKLRIFHLELYKSMESIQYYSNQSNNIQAFYINISNESDYQIMNLCLIQMLKLKRLEILNYDYDYPKLLILKQSIVFLEVQNVKLKWNFKYIQTDFLERLITKMPMIEQLYLDIFCCYLDKVFFKTLIDHWWFIIIKLNQIHIFIRGNIDFPRISSKNRRKMLEYYQQRLFYQNEKINRRFKITWTQNDDLEGRFMKILIC